MCCGPAAIQSPSMSSQVPFFIFQREDNLCEWICKLVLLVFQRFRSVETINAYLPNLSEKNIQWLSKAQIQAISITRISNELSREFLQKFLPTQVANDFTEEQRKAYFEKCNNQQPHDPTFFENSIEVLLKFFSKIDVSEVDENMLSRYWDAVIQRCFNCKKNLLKIRDAHTFKYMSQDMQSRYFNALIERNMVHQALFKPFGDSVRLDKELLDQMKKCTSFNFSRVLDQIEWGKVNWSKALCNRKDYSWLLDEKYESANFMEMSKEDRLKLFTSGAAELFRQEIRDRYVVELLRYNEAYQLVFSQDGKEFNQWLLDVIKNYPKMILSDVLQKISLEGIDPEHIRVLYSYGDDGKECVWSDEQMKTFIKNSEYFRALLNNRTFVLRVMMLEPTRKYTDLLTLVQYRALNQKI
ncbi:MAG: hypothetical protein P4L16_05615 [Chlamydiales bacterium]|nr:hypothetical protein [Chlamydiales bacterium]